MAASRSTTIPLDARLAALISPYAWDAATITYGFPVSKAAYGARYGDQAAASFSAFSAAQKAAAARALDADSPLVSAAARSFAVEGFTRLGIDADGGQADLRFGNTKAVDTAYAYYPSAVAEGGDLWFGGGGRKPVPGNYDQAVLLHELGHALGLKHVHEAEAGRPRLALPWDGVEYTVMSYRSETGGKIGYWFESFGAPQTWMMLDIAALQELYGADYGANRGNTVYSWRPGSGQTLVDGKVAIDPGDNRIFMTVWDGVVVDAYDLGAYRTGVSINLEPGASSRFSTDQRAIVDWRDGERAAGNVYNALLHDGDPRSLIENAIGGSGADRIVGNGAANRLEGGAGSDALFGRGGGDRLEGGTGVDRLMGGPGDDVFVFASAGHSAPGRRTGSSAAAERRPSRARAGDHAFVFAGGPRPGRLDQPGRLWAVEVKVVYRFDIRLQGENETVFLDV